MRKTLAVIGSILAILVIVFGAYFTLDTKHASAMDFQSFKQRAEKRWIEDDWYSVRKRIWSLEDRYTYDKAKMLPEYQELILERERLELKLKGK